MNVSAMATKEGNYMVNRIVEAGVRLVAEHGSTRREAQQFMEKSIVTLSCGVAFDEADSARVQIDAMNCFRERLEALGTVA